MSRRSSSRQILRKQHRIRSSLIGDLAILGIPVDRPQEETDTLLNTMCIVLVYCTHMFCFYNVFEYFYVFSNNIESVPKKSIDKKL